MSVCTHLKGQVMCDKGWIVCNPNYCKGKAGYIECDDYETEATGEVKTDCLKCKSYKHCKILKITNYTEITECQEYVPLEDVK